MKARASTGSRGQVKGPWRKISHFRRLPRLDKGSASPTQAAPIGCTPTARRQPSQDLWRLPNPGGNCRPLPPMPGTHESLAAAPRADLAEIVFISTEAHRASLGPRRRLPTHAGIEQTHYLVAETAPRTNGRGAVARSGPRLENENETGKVLMTPRIGVRYAGQRWSGRTLRFVFAPAS